MVESPELDGRRMKTYTLQALPEDRLVVISDGISQSGIGSPELKLGWRVEGWGQRRACRGEGERHARTANSSANAKTNSIWVGSPLR